MTKHSGDGRPDLRGVAQAFIQAADSAPNWTGNDAMLRAFRELRDALDGTFEGTPADIRWVMTAPVEDHGPVHVHHLVAIVDCAVGDEACSRCRADREWEAEAIAFMDRFHPEVDGVRQSWPRRP